MARPCDITHLEAVNNYGIQLVTILSAQPLPAQPLPVWPKIMLRTLHSTQLEDSASLSVLQLSAFAFCIPFVWWSCFGLALAPVLSLILLLLRLRLPLSLSLHPLSPLLFHPHRLSKPDSPRCSTTSDCFGMPLAEAETWLASWKQLTACVCLWLALVVAAAHWGDLESPMDRLIISEWNI